MTVSSTATLNQLKTALAAGNRAGANAAIARLLATKAALGAQWRSLATLSLHHGEVTQAVAAIDRFASAMGDNPAARLERATFLARAGRLTEAQEALAAIDARSVDSAALWFARATVAMDLGELDAARSLLADVVSARPDAGLAWLSLATIGGLRDEADRRALRAAEPDVMRGSVGAHAAWCYATAKVHADRDEVDAAFAAVTRGAALRRRAMRYDRAADAMNAQQAIGGTPPPRQASRSEPDRGLPILVTGLPRSGTTLVEQILSGHSAVAGGGELNVLRLVAQDVGGTSADAVAGSGLPPQALASLYTHLLAERFDGTGRVVDKSLTTSRLLGVALSILPDMPVIWMRRDPLDTAWSCFRTHFAGGAPWSLDLDDMAYHFRLEDQLHRFWSDRLGDRMLTVDYRSLVEDPAGITRQVLSHCNLPDEPGPHAPHLNRRAVTTSSVAQVRRPINRDGLGAAEPYRRHLSPFLKAYQAS